MAGAGVAGDDESDEAGLDSVEPVDSAVDGDDEEPLRESVR